MLWLTCGAADGLVGINRQFKDWLRAKNIRFTEEEAPDVGHVWPYWRKNLAEFAQRVFQPTTK
jgi:enterochelin esterase-like enzyme